MEENKGKPVEWWVENARTFNKIKPDEPKLGKLHFKQAAVTQAAGESVPPAGVPIDADLAVHFIKNFIDSYGLVDFESLEAETDVANLKSALNKSISFAKGLIDLTYGVTFDKDILLKILSQPNCEGLRLYFCARGVNSPPHISLVVVGVDKEQYDLNYKGVPIIDEKDTALPNNSLIGEYGYPPDKITLEDKETDEHYYLLKKAVSK